MSYVANIWCNQCLIGVSILNYILMRWYDRYWRVKSFFFSVNVFDVNSNITFFSWWISHFLPAAGICLSVFPWCWRYSACIQRLGEHPFCGLTSASTGAVNSGLISWVEIPWSPLRALIKLISVHAQSPKYKYRTVIWQQQIHLKSKKRPCPSNITFVKYIAKNLGVI